MYSKKELLEISKEYFSNHTGIDVFYATHDSMFFTTYQDAANHGGDIGSQVFTFEKKGDDIVAVGMNEYDELMDSLEAKEETSSENTQISAEPSQIKETTEEPENAPSSAEPSQVEETAVAPENAPSSAEPSQVEETPVAPENALSVVETSQEKVKPTKGK